MTRLQRGYIKTSFFLIKPITMKKCLTLILASMLCLASFANSPGSFKSSMAPWDKPLIAMKVVKVQPVNPLDAKGFTDPYVTNYGAYVIGTFNAPNYACNIQVSFNQTVGVPYYAIVQVFGDWNFDGANNGASYREFTILFSGAQHYKSVNFPMAPSEEAYTSLVDLLDYGPQ